MQVSAFGLLSDALAVPVSPTSPGLFTQNGTGQSAAAILNQDNSLNTPRNPGQKGSVFRIFLTGEGMTNPRASRAKSPASTSKRPFSP